MVSPNFPDVDSVITSVPPKFFKYDIISSPFTLQVYKAQLEPLYKEALTIPTYL